MAQRISVLILIVTALLGSAPLLAADDASVGKDLKATAIPPTDTDTVELFGPWLLVHGQKKEGSEHAGNTALYDLRDWSEKLHGADFDEAHFWPQPPR